mgnify:CR=1 FL=1
MTKVELKLLTGASAINTAITSISKRGKSLEKDIHVAAVSCLIHADKHGDITLAEKLVQGYLDGFPQLKEWREASRQQVKDHGFIKNYVGRVRHLPKVKRIYQQVGDRMMDWRYRKELETQVPTKTNPKTGKIISPRDQVTQAYRDYRNGLNNCLNFQLQSLAAAVVNRAALVINRKAKELGIDAIVQAQVHDQLIINVDEKDAEMFAPIVQEIMENTTQLPGVTLKAPPEISNNWRDGH